MRDNKTGGHLAGDPSGLFHRQRAAPESRTQGLAVEELGNQIRPSIDHADVEDFDDVRVVERGGDTGLLQEPSDTLGVVRAAVGHELQRNIPSQAHVCGAVDIAHPPAGKQPDDAIRSDKGIGAEQRVVLYEIAGGERERRSFEKARQARARRRQSVSFLDQVRMIGAELTLSRSRSSASAASQALCHSDNRCHRSVLMLLLEQ